MANSSNSTKPILTQNREIPIHFLDTPLPSSLKFITTTVKNIIQTQVNADNHPTWKSHILILFCANGFEGYLTGTSQCPNPVDEIGDNVSNPQYLQWHWIDENLASALYSTVSPSIPPYIH